MATSKVTKFDLDDPQYPETETAVETVEVRFTSVIEEIRLGHGGRTLFHELMSIIGEYERNGVYEVPDGKDGKLSVTVEGL